MYISIPAEGREKYISEYDEVLNDCALGTIISNLLSLDESTIRDFADNVINNHDMYTAIESRRSLVCDSAKVIGFVRRYSKQYARLYGDTTTGSFFELVLYPIAVRVVNLNMGNEIIDEICEFIEHANNYVTLGIEDNFFAQLNVFNLACQMGMFVLPKRHYSAYAESNTDTHTLAWRGFSKDSLKETLTHKYNSIVNNETAPCEYYEISDYREYISCLLWEVYRGGLNFKICHNCGKMFVPLGRSDTLYCDRQAPQDTSKTCKEYGARQTWQNTLKENEAAGLYRKIYMSKQMLARRNPDILEYSQSFELYKSQSKQWKSDVKSGTKTEAEYIEWLKAVKEKKVL